MLLKRWHLLKEVMADKHLNAAALKVMFFLLNRENSKTKALFPSHLRLSEDTNLSERQVRRGIKSLLNENYIVILRKGSPGRATSYKINYQQRTRLVLTQDNIGQKRGSKASDQSTKQSTNESSKVNKEDVDKLILRTKKMFNPNYKAVVNGTRPSYNSDEQIYQRILKKTEDPNLAEQWLKLQRSPDWNDKVRAEQIAKHLQCLK